ncbi:MAG: hypothetical protein IJK58_06900 [Clostridia bacterium]|nr:hypothetical protein [Clostridia bacterium]
MSKLNVSSSIDEMFSKMTKEEIFRYLDSIGLKYSKGSAHATPRLKSHYRSGVAKRQMNAAHGRKISTARVIRMANGKSCSYIILKKEDTKE